MSPTSAQLAALDALIRCGDGKAAAHSLHITWSAYRMRMHSLRAATGMSTIELIVARIVTFSNLATPRASPHAYPRGPRKRHIPASAVPPRRAPS